MCNDIKYIFFLLSCCGTCQVFDDKKAHVHLSRMPVANYPHQIISMDLVGPFHRSRYEHYYLFTLIDHLSGWADAYPMRRVRPFQIFCLKDIFLSMESRRFLISDNGFEFCNSEVEGILAKFGIKTLHYHYLSSTIKWKS